ncbi:MAG: SpoIID/LytB domain-containing protein [Actinomycetota bacterium]
MAAVTAAGVLGAAVLLGATASPALAQERTVTITGGGYGHGIGMSQYGAYGRAKNGKSAEQILEHYYSGASVQQRPSSGKVRVGLLPGYGSNQGSLSLTSEAISGDGKLAVKVKGERAALVNIFPGDELRAEAASTGGIRLFKNGERVRRDGEAVFGSGDTPLLAIFEKFGSALKPSAKPHRYLYGKAELGTYQSSACGEGRCIRLVLALGMQKYLYGLGEVPSSWPMASLKSQAIAGRTYAQARKQRYSEPELRACGCHVYDSTIDQAYIGDSKRTGSGSYWDEWKTGVDETKDQLIIHDDQIVEYALYSSSSGGHTEHNENVWGGTPVPYLRGVPDAPDKAGGDNPNFTWTVTMTYSEFSRKLDARFGIGELKDFELLKPFGISGRVIVPQGDTAGARIVGTAKTVHESGWNLRSALGLKDSLFRVDLGFEVGAVFAKKYDSLDGAPGRPTSKVYDVPKGWDRARGRAQNFTHGRMTYTEELDKIVWQHGPILKRYNAMGREKGKLGMPKTSIWTGEGYAGAAYLAGRLIRVIGEGIYPILGGFDAAFVRSGGIGGQLGLPRGPRSGHEELPGGGRRQRFDGGTLYKAGTGGGVFALFDKIDSRYRKLGQATSDCGYPTADMTKEGEDWRALFEQGTIVLRADGELQVRCG